MCNLPSLYFYVSLTIKCSEFAAVSARAEPASPTTAKIFLPVCCAAPMFTYKFSKRNRKTPQFELDGVPLCMSVAPGFLCVEYCGKSFREVECRVEVHCDAEEYACNYAFCLASRWLEIPLGGDALPASVAVDLHVAKDGAGPAYPGLPNLGATCYINSLLQTLYHLPGFKGHVYASTGYYSLLLQRLFHRMDAAKGCSDGQLYEAVCCLIRNMSFVDSVHTHQDIHEFSKIFFDRLEGENRALKGYIEGTHVKMIECECGCVSTKEDPFQDIQLHLKDANGPVHSMEDALGLACAKDSISGYKCESHGPTNATSRVLFKELPDVLFVLVSRFSVDWERDEFVKNNGFFSFPESVCFDQYMYKGEGEEAEPAEPADRDVKQHKGNSDKGANKSSKYKLFSVMVHSGVADEGHFYCYLREHDGLFYKFNDKHVYQCSKEEAMGWNFGGPYAHSSKEKSFSAYYLVYTREGTDGIESIVGTDSTAAIDKSKADAAPMLDSRVTEPRKPIQCSFLTNESISGYTGLGPFNISDPSYPLLVPAKASCYALDNVLKIFPNRPVYDSSLARVKDAAVDEDEVYFVADQDGPLIFVKAYQESAWCNYPTSLHALGTFPIKNLKDFDRLVDFEGYRLYKEAECSAGHECVVTDMSQLKSGDVVIISQTNVCDYLDEYRKHQLLSVSVDGVTAFCLFVRRGLSAADTEKKIQEFVGSDEIFVVDTASSSDSGISSDNEGIEQQQNEQQQAEQQHSEQHAVNCLVNSGDLFYVGVQNGVDINNIEHIHVFLLPENSPASSLVKQFRLAKSVCMTQLQAAEDLQIVESFKESTNARILNYNDTLTPNNSFLIIQHRISDPLRVSFYRNCYQLINYPFFIENPGSVRSLRETFFFANKIVRFDGANYAECAIDDLLDLKNYEILLIEQK
ncbi:ubiquitin carboxyl-terminal hydrolase 7 [Pancytospora philotis]|nr:ubiquitin carboxyl-terminal hydrolase 7 [Pancytospora philotis]